MWPQDGHPVLYVGAGDTRNPQFLHIATLINAETSPTKKLTPIAIQASENSGLTVVNRTSPMTQNRINSTDQRIGCGDIRRCQ